jgi:hypothetical protein
MTTIQQGQVGLAIEIAFVSAAGAVVDISSATAKLIRLEFSTALAVQFVASFVTDGTDGLITYLTVSSAELGFAGTTKIQGEITLPNGALRTAIGKFTIHRNLPIATAPQLALDLPPALTFSAPAVQIS